MLPSIFIQLHEYRLTYLRPRLLRLLSIAETRNHYRQEDVKGKKG